MRPVSFAVFFLAAIAAVAQVNVSYPANGATVTSPVQFNAAAYSAHNAAVTAMRVYVDGNNSYTVNGSSLNTAVPIALGGHQVTVQAWDATGAVYQSNLTLNVASSPAAGVAISSPANGATVNSPMQVVASASGNAGVAITAMQVYVDNQLAWSGAGASVNTALNLTAGGHYIVVQSWDAWGNVNKSAVNVNVASGSGAVSLTSPANGATVNSPMQVAGSATPTYGASITATQIYVDDALIWTGNSASINASLNVGGGTHNVVVQAWDSYGNLFRTASVVNVQAESYPQLASAQLYDNIDQMPGWDSCSSCAGPWGYGANVPYSTTQGRTNPSIDGSSMQFWLGGAAPYSNALWWKQLTPQPSASNFVYDLYFYSDAPQYAQALEFDVNQTVGGLKYIFGTECNIRGDGQWDIWSSSGWQPTGIACPQPSAYTWHHVTLELQRQGGTVVFVAISMDGQRNYINRGFDAQWVGGNELNVAFQMDGDYAQHNYSVWLDRVRLFYW